LIGIVVIALISYGAYTKFANPFASSYTAHIIFSNANGLKPDSQVRIAGVNVGKVQSVTPVAGCQKAPSTAVGQQCTASDVTVQIDGNGLPLHKDATFWIRPRIFLEGNFFIQATQGTPEAPVAPNGYVFPIQQGRGPVQFDQLLTSLQLPTRESLQILLQQYGLAVKRGGPAYNASIAYWTPAYQYGSEVSHDALGTQPHDLSNWINQSGVVNGALDAHRQNLKNLITDFNTTAGAFAREDVALQNALRELPTTLQVAIPALNSLNNAFPPLRAFARALVPGVVSTGPMVDASLPFFHQLRLLVQPAELQGLVHDLSFTVPALAKLNAETIPFMKNQVRPASSCQVNVILPWTHLTIHDRHFNASNGFPPRQVYVEGVNYLPGLAGESRSFDTNGPYVRILGTGGTFTYSLQPGLFGQALAPITGVAPQPPAPHNSGDGAPIKVERPPLKSHVPCETQPAITESQLNNNPTGTGPKQIHTTLSPQAAKLEQLMVPQALTQLINQAHLQGLKVNLKP
ncbi:MAG TPA: MlaD family protein, partial [Solirubrobacteraceae bacterium]|nr:MlaD family protein [Solirubrobacteraceae bacterium]